MLYFELMQMQDSPGSVSRSASHFLTGTFISRFTGMIRDLSMAFCFGTEPAVAAFLIAFRLSNLLRRLFGEGALLNGFIPFFESKRKEDPVEGAKFFRDLFWSLICTLLIVVLCIEGLLTPFALSSSLSYNVKQIIYMSMIMVPGLLFICLFGLSMALLNCERNFFIPGVAPVAFNIVWIISVWLLRSVPPYKAMMGISGAIVLAFFLQWWVTTPGIFRYVYAFITKKEWLRPKLFSKDLGRLVAPLFLGVIGVAAVQINSAIDVIMARFASLEGPAYLSYAHRLQQLPLALFGIAVSSALMPPLTRAIRSGDFEHYRRLLKFGFLRTFSLLFPGTLAIVVLGGASVNMLYGRGVFDTTSTIYTTLSLWGYGVGLVPMAFVLLLAPAFYSRRDYRTPMAASLYSVLVNLSLNALMIFYFKLGAPAIAFATSITATFNMWYLNGRLKTRVFPSLIAPFMKVVVASIVATIVTLAFGHVMLKSPVLTMLSGNLSVHFPRALFHQLGHFTLLTSTFGLTFLATSYLIKAESVLELFSFLLKPKPQTEAEVEAEVEKEAEAISAGEESE